VVQEIKSMIAITGTHKSKTTAPQQRVSLQQRHCSEMSLPNLQLNSVQSQHLLLLRGKEVRTLKM
jgi:hypothetical protein